MISLAKHTGKDKYAGLMIYKSKNGDITYYMKYRDHNNKVVKQAIKGIENITHEKAYKELMRVKFEVEKRKLNQPVAKKRVSTLKTLNEMANYYFETHDFKSKQMEIQRYNRHIKDEGFAKKLFELIDFDELDDWVDKLKKKKPTTIKDVKSKKTLSPKSISNTITLCIAIVKYAKSNRKYYGEILFDQVKKPKVDNVRLKQMSEDEIQEFWQILKQEDRTNNKLGYLYGLLALSLGAREQTILNIKKDDIDFEKGIIHLYNFKTETKYLGHIVNNEIRNALEDIVYYSDYIFFNIDTKQRYKKAPFIVRRILDKIVNFDRNEDDKITVRDLRNVFATRLINKGMNLSHIQNLLNHKTPTMTTRYAQMLDTTGGEELKKMFEGL